MSRNPRQVFVELQVILAQAGDPQAMGRLATLFQRELVAYSFRLVADADIAQDVVQEAWLSVMHGIGRLNDPASFRAWVFRIVHHKSMDSLRTRIGERNELANLQQSSLANSNIVDVDPPNEVDHLRKLIHTLSAADRGLLTLYYENNLSLREIALITGYTESMTKSKLYHLRQKLKQQLTLRERSNHG